METMYGKRGRHLQRIGMSPSQIGFLENKKSLTLRNTWELKVKKKRRKILNGWKNS